MEEVNQFQLKLIDVAARIPRGGALEPGNVGKVGTGPQTTILLFSFKQRICLTKIGHSLGSTTQDGDRCPDRCGCEKGTEGWSSSAKKCMEGNIKKKHNIDQSIRNAHFSRFDYKG